MGSLKPNRKLAALAWAAIAACALALPRAAYPGCSGPADQGGLCAPGMFGDGPAQPGAVPTPSLGGPDPYYIPGTNIPDRSQTEQELWQHDHTGPSDLESAVTKNQLMQEDQYDPQSGHFIEGQPETGILSDPSTLPGNQPIDPGMEVTPADSSMKKKDKDDASKRAFNNDDIHKNDDAAGAEVAGNQALGSAGASDVAAAGDAVGAGGGGGGVGSGGGGGGGTTGATSGGTLNAATAGQVTAQQDPNHPSTAAGGLAGGAGSGGGAPLGTGGKTQEQLQKDAAYVARVARESQLRRAQYNALSAIQNLARQQQHMSNIGKFSGQAAGDQQKQQSLGQAIGEQQKAGNSMLMQALSHALSAASQFAAARQDGNTAQTAVHNAAALSARARNAAPVFSLATGGTPARQPAAAQPANTPAKESSPAGQGSNGASDSLGSGSDSGSGSGDTATKAAATAGGVTSQDDPARKNSRDPEYAGPLARFLPSDPDSDPESDATDILKDADTPRARAKRSAFQNVAGQ